MTESTPTKWTVYRLADDRETYGDNAGKLIITTADGEEEITGVAFRDEDAHRIVQCVNAHERLLFLLQAALVELEEWMDAFPGGSHNTPPVIEDIKATFAVLEVEEA